MTDQQILEKAIQKARDNGWNKEAWDVMEGLGVSVAAYAKSLTTDKTWLQGNIEFALLYDHDFARAIWGDGPIDFPIAKNIDARYADGAWKWHLQQMVVSDDPIKYLGENI